MIRHWPLVTLFSLLVGCYDGVSQSEGVETSPSASRSTPVLTLKQVWEGRFHDAEGVRRQLLSMLPTLAPEDRALAHIYLPWLTVYYGAAGDTANSRAELQSAVQNAGQLGFPCAAARGGLYVVTDAMKSISDISDTVLGDWIDRSMKWAGQCGDKDLMARLSHKSAQRYRLKGNQVDQYRELISARDLSEPDTQLNLDIRYDLAAMRHDLGDVTDGGAEYRSLLEGARAQSHNKLIVTLLMSLGQVELDLGRGGAATEWFGQALDGAQQQNLPAEVVQAQLNLAWAALETGEGRADPKVARGWLEQVDRSVLESDIPRRRFKYPYVEARLLLAEGRVDDAYQHLTALLETQAEPEPRWRTWQALADVARVRRDLQAEREALWQAVNLLEEQRRTTLLVWWSLAHHSQRVGLYLRWLDVLVESWLAGGRLGQSTGGKWEPAPTFTRGPVSADDLLAAVEKLSADQLQLDRITDRGGLEGLLTTLPPGGESGPFQWRSGAALRRLLPASQQHLFYVPLPHRILALRLDSLGVEPQLIAVSDDELETLVKAARHPFDVPTDEVPAALDKLGHLLLEPFKATLPPPDVPLGFTLLGSLEEVPISALKWQGSYLVERWYPYELPGLRFLESKPATGEGTPSAVVVAVGEGLQSAREETAIIQATGMATRVFQGEEANPAAVRRALRGAHLIHFDVHGGTSDQPAGGKNTTPFRVLRLFQGFLDLATLDPGELTNALVVLASCGSASGITGVLESGWGAPHRGALAAGASAVVASRWNVGDSATQQLMTYFYQRHNIPGTARRLALAQREMIKAHRPLSASTGTRAHERSEADRPLALTTTHPWSWAGFTVVGSME